MRETLWVVSVLFLLMTIGAPNAHADSITNGTINFTVSSGSPAPTGSFSFDNTTNAFTSVEVEWDGGGFLFSPLFGIVVPPTTTSGSWSAAGPSVTFNQFGPAIFALFIGPTTLSTFSPSAFTDFTDPNAIAGGTFTLTSVATPEPSSVALMLLGVGLVFVMRKRIGRGLPQAS
jgi:hypothetical protein